MLLIVFCSFTNIVTALHHRFTCRKTEWVTSVELTRTPLSSCRYPAATAATAGPCWTQGAKEHINAPWLDHWTGLLALALLLVLCACSLCWRLPSVCLSSKAATVGWPIQCRNKHKHTWRVPDNVIFWCRHAEYQTYIHYNIHRPICVLFHKVEPPWYT
jgi:hypothetical protein